MPRRQNSSSVTNQTTKRESSSTNQHEKKFWQIIIGITQIILAICAGFGIYISLQSSKQTSQTLLQASEAFQSYSFPVVKFSHYQWITNSDILNCESPAIGINVYFRNFSGVPVVIEKKHMELFMGERPILGEAETKTGVEGEIIFSSGEQTALGRTDEEEFPEYYKRMEGPSPPYLNFALSIVYRSIVTGK